MIFTEKEEIAIHKMLDTLKKSKQKYYILKYINNTEKYHPLRNILCEALFRNIILELYSIIFDDRRGTIAKTIIDKLVCQTKKFNGEFEFKLNITVHNIDDDTTEIQPIDYKFNLSIDGNNNDANFTNLNISETRLKFKKYRNKNLAHKDFSKFDYHILQDDIDMLINESEKIITALLKIAKPQTAYSFDISPFVNDLEITMLFDILAGNKKFPMTKAKQLI